MPRPPAGRAPHDRRPRPALAALLDALGTDRAHVLAHSSGVLVALQLAQDRPDAVGSLDLVEPSPGGSLAPPSFAPVAQEVVRPAVGAAATGDTATAFDTSMRGVCAEDYRAVLEAALGPDGVRRAERDARYFFADEVPAALEWSFAEPEAAGVRQPVLVVLGGASPPPAHELVARLAGLVPHAEVATVEGSDHLLPLRDPADLGRLAAGFARRHGAAARA